MKNPLRFFAVRKRKFSVSALACGVGVALLLPACAGRKEFQRGYERGASDTVKRQYWILQNLQKRENASRPDRRLSVYRMQVTPDPNSTVQTVPYEISVPVYH